MNNEAAREWYRIITNYTAALAPHGWDAGPVLVNVIGGLALRVPDSDSLLTEEYYRYFDKGEK